MAQPKIIGLTGNIGSGKSTVAELFAMYDWPVFNSDLASKTILVKSKNVIKKIVLAFGEGILDTNKQIVNKNLASLVFNNPGNLKILNEIIHPEVKNLFIRWLAKQNSPYIIRESALLFEAGIHTESYKNILVTCPFEERVKRVLFRGGINENEIRDREKMQMVEDNKIKKSDFIITNFDQPLLPQLVKIHSEILRSN